MFDTSYRLAKRACVVSAATQLTSLVLSATLAAAHLPRSRPYLTFAAAPALHFARPFVAGPLPPASPAPRASDTEFSDAPVPAMFDFTLDGPALALPPGLTFDATLDSVLPPEFDSAFYPRKHSSPPGLPNQPGSNPINTPYPPPSELIPDLPRRAPVSLDDVLPFFVPSGPPPSRATYRRT